MFSVDWLQFGTGFAGGIVACLLVYGILALKLFRLQLQVGAIQNGLLGMRNKQAAEKRWTRNEELEEFMKSNHAPRTERFANDPLGY